MGLLLDIETGDVVPIVIISIVVICFLIAAFNLLKWLYQWLFGTKELQATQKEQLAEMKKQNELLSRLLSDKEKKHNEETQN